MCTLYFLSVLYLFRKYESTVQSSCTTTFVQYFRTFVQINTGHVTHARTVRVQCTVLSYFEKNQQKNVLVTKTSTKGYARAPARETYLLPRMRSRRVSFCTIAFQASTPNFLRRGFCVHALCRERGTRTSRIAISGKIYDFFVTRAKVVKPRRNNILRMP